MTMKTTYAGASHNGLSPAMWYDCPINEIKADPSIGYGFFEDFDKLGLITAPTTSAALVGTPLSGFSEDASQIINFDALGGAVQIKQTTDDHGTSIFSLSHCFNTTKLGGDLWFEARITPSHTATTEQGMFVGLADATAKADDVPLLAAASALADLNLVGFHKLDTDLTSVKTVYKADGVTAVTLETITSALTAGTAVKLGFKFQKSDAFRMSFYINNVRQATQKVLPDATGTDFPADVLMAPCIALHLGAGANDNIITIDWVGCYQLRV